jgi:hypothetical protein
MESGKVIVGRTAVGLFDSKMIVRTTRGLHGESAIEWLWSTSQKISKLTRLDLRSLSVLCRFYMFIVIKLFV